MDATHETLTRFDQNFGDPSVEMACYRLMVVLPETWRFPTWYHRVQHIFAFYESTPVDPPGTPALDSYDNLFHCWRRISVRLLDGPELFHTHPLLARFPHYHMLLTVISEDSAS